MTRNSNNQGRAFEYICLLSLYEEISKIRPASILKNSSYDVALHAWNNISEHTQKLLALSARSTIQTIFTLEPNIIEVSKDLLTLYIQPDNRGEEADVRDIIIERKNIIWEIGLSIKHNHMAVKHSRLSKHIDFGEKWYGVKCSQAYWEEVEEVFSLLEKAKAQKIMFRDIPSKEETIYVPILKAFMKEITKKIDEHKDVPKKMIEYLLSKYDFYKVVSIDNKRITTIQSFNIYGTLNQKSRSKEPDLKIPKIKLPTTLLHIGFKPNSKTTILMCFENGWQFSFRLHNAKDYVEPSLKFDIQVIGMPAEVNIKFNCHWENK